MTSVKTSKTKQTKPETLEPASTAFSSTLYWQWTLELTSNPMMLTWHHTIPFNGVLTLLIQATESYHWKTIQESSLDALIRGLCKSSKKLRPSSLQRVHTAATQKHMLIFLNFRGSNISWISPLSVHFHSSCLRCENLLQKERVHSS